MKMLANKSIHYQSMNFKRASEKEPDIFAPGIMNACELLSLLTHTIGSS